MQNSPIQLNFISKRSIALSNRSKITLYFMQYYLLLWQVYSKSVYHTQLTIVDSLSSSLFLFKGIIIHHLFILRIYIKLWKFSYINIAIYSNIIYNQTTPSNNLQLTVCTHIVLQATPSRSHLLKLRLCWCVAVASLNGVKYGVKLH